MPGPHRGWSPYTARDKVICGIIFGLLAVAVIVNLLKKSGVIQEFQW